jgi:hypothetical protein
MNTVLREILLVWEENPHLRFNQLIGNMARGDQYYVEDDEMVRKLHAYRDVAAMARKNG